MSVQLLAQRGQEHLGRDLAGLGVGLRLGEDATQRLLTEVGKDLTNVPLENIERAIAGP